MSTGPLRAEAAVAHRAISTLPRFLLFPALAVLGYVGLIGQWGGDHWAVQTGWILFLSYCWFCVGGSFHESVHHTLCDSTRISVWYGRIVGTVIGIPYSAYRETHRRHHAYLNTPQDYEMWPYSDPTTSLRFRRLFVWIDIVGAIVTSPIIYGRLFWTGDKSLKDDVRKAIRREYIAMGISWAVIVIAIALAMHNGWFDWREFNPVWLLPLVISYMFNTIRKFTEHLGMPSIDPVEGTRTVMGDNFVTRLCSYFNWDISIHGPHHRYPRAKHYELEPKLRQLEAAAGDTRLPVFSTYSAAIWHMLPNLWHNPAVGQTARQGERGT